MKTRGMTLIELLVTLVLGGIMAYTVGMIIVATFTEQSRSFQKANRQNDVRFFERQLGKQFRSALNEAAFINNGGGTTPVLGSGSFLRFVSYRGDGNTINEFFQYVYHVQNGQLVCDITPMSRVAGVLQPQAGATTQVVMDNVLSAQFSWVGWPASHTVRADITQQQTMAGGLVYAHTDSFTVTSRNRI